LRFDLLRRQNPQFAQEARLSVLRDCLGGFQYAVGLISSLEQGEQRVYSL
jgi:hypothetical protein